MSCGDGHCGCGCGDFVPLKSLEEKAAAKEKQKSSQGKQENQDPDERA